MTFLMKGKFRKALIIILFFVTVIGFSNSPTPPPYRRFKVSGEILCDSIINKSNYAITLYGKSHHTNNKFIRAFCHETWNSNTALTDSIGFYLLVADNDFEFDSIKTAIMIAGQEPIFSDVFYIDPTKRNEHTITYTYDDHGVGCCENTVEPQNAKSRIERYEYHLGNVVIKLCD
jgi:hypothetical protein